MHVNTHIKTPLPTLQQTFTTASAKLRGFETRISRTCSGWITENISSAGIACSGKMRSQKASVSCAGSLRSACAAAM